MRIFLKQLFASKLKITISSLGIIALLAFSGIMIFQMTKVEVAFAEDGEEKIIQTHAKTVAELLEELNITPGEHDALSHRLNEKLANGMNIAFTTGKDVTLTIDNQDQHYITTAGTVGEFLQNEGLQLSSHDEATFEESDEIEDGMHLKLAKAFQIIINDGGKKRKVWATANQTYGQVLADNDIAYKNNSDDKMNNKLDDHVKKGKDLTITRIAYAYKEKEITEPFDTVKKYDDSIDKGTEKVTQAGKNGLSRVKYRVMKKNNKHADKEMVSKETLRQTQNKIIVIGTKEPEATVAQMSNKPENVKNSEEKKPESAASSNNNTKKSSSS
ncbi:ubiquitin-like domain-containing protein [Virgibacillus halophilus]|uniref:Ubiquitin-like domain-containing protein n=1 Tax=Tigheibacillus halophilus TaxID=361280 RepID=A0ABU5C8E0_9BACI|nr:ubiquitin-like domain-containing protein [Virgibacillus halophilus]